MLLITLFKAIQSWNGSSEETNHNLYEGGLKQWAMCHVVDPYVVITPIYKHMFTQTIYITKGKIKLKATKGKLNKQKGTEISNY